MSSHAVVELTHCPNCGEDLSGAYCARCGQKVTALNPTFHDLLHDIVHEFMHVDGKIFESVRLLITRPGVLSREHFEGRRVRYVSPIRLYLIFSVVFFLVGAALSTPLTEEDRAELAREAGPIASAMNPEFAHDVEAWLPRTMFVLVPVFAVLTAAATRSSRRNYPQHLYFALHVHAGVFAFATLWMLLRLALPAALERVVDVILIGVVVWYVVTAFRTAYGLTWRHAVGRAAVVGLTYLIAYAAALACLVGIALFVMRAS